MKYRRRVPKVLMAYINKAEIIKVVGSQEEAVNIDTKLDNALRIAKSSFADSTKRALIEEELKGLAQPKLQETPFRYADAVRLYLEQSRVSEREHKNRDYFFNELLPNLLRYVFEKNPVTAEITSSHLNEIVSILQKLPSRNYVME
ncbi:MAG: hypothetical protein WBG65_10005 [Sulfurimonadaceae bacterium]